MKLGRFIIDSHVHAQRFAAGKAIKDAHKPDENKRDVTEQGDKYSGLHDAITAELEPYDNSARLLYDMDCYGVDMAILTTAFNMTNELNLQIVEKNPGRFVALCAAQETRRKALTGEIEWTAEAAAKELDDLLSTGKFIGIGEGFPNDPKLGVKKAKIDRFKRLDEIRCFMEIARKHKVPVRWHTGLCMGYNTGYSTGMGANPDTFYPMWVHDIAIEYPDVPIIFEHGGIQAWWWERWYEECLNVAAATDNVYIETGLWWTGLYEKALMDPNIGAKKLVWGTDWGASIPFHWQPGKYPEVYPLQKRKSPPVRHQVDFYGWSLRQLARLEIPQDDLNLILGGNIARIYNIPLPHTRLFPFID